MIFYGNQYRILYIENKFYLIQNSITPPPFLPAAGYLPSEREGRNSTATLPAGKRESPERSEVSNDKTQPIGKNWTAVSVAPLSVAIESGRATFLGLVSTLMQGRARGMRRVHPACRESRTILPVLLHHPGSPRWPARYRNSILFCRGDVRVRRV